MLLLRTAFKNILSGGKRTWLNVAVLSFVLVLMVAFNAMLDGWMEEAQRDTREWETGNGQYWHPQYDRYDIFTLQDAHGAIPTGLQPQIQAGMAVPVLVFQGSIYPQGRMQNILLRGIPVDQHILKIPSEKLQKIEGEIPAVIGTRMARAANLRVGDRVMLRWRDKNGAFDAREVLITHIFDNKVPAVDSGQLWLSLDDLYDMTGTTGEATYIVTSAETPVPAGDWPFHDNDFLMYDLKIMGEAQQVESVIIFIILLSIALLSVYDTQVLSIFRRQKEIGTYVALGMTPWQVTLLFTIEGTIYSLLAILVGAVWGTPLLILFAKTGLPLPQEFNDIGMAIGDALMPAYHFGTIARVILIVVGMSALISFIPARKIARQNMVLALKGKIE